MVTQLKNYIFEALNAKEINWLNKILKKRRKKVLFDNCFVNDKDSSWIDEAADNDLGIKQEVIIITKSSTIYVFENHYKHLQHLLKKNSKTWNTCRVPSVKVTTWTMLESYVGPTRAKSKQNGEAKGGGGSGSRVGDRY